MEDKHFHIDNWLRDAAAHQAGKPAGDAVKQKAWAQLRGRMDRGPFWQRYGWLPDVLILVTMGVFIWWSNGVAQDGTPNRLEQHAVETIGSERGVQQDDGALASDDLPIDIQTEENAASVKTGGSLKDDDIVSAKPKEKVLADWVDKKKENDTTREAASADWVVDNGTTREASANWVDKKKENGTTRAAAPDWVTDNGTVRKAVSADLVTKKKNNGTTRETASADLKENVTSHKTASQDREGDHANETPIGIQPENIAPQNTHTDEADIHAVFIPILPIDDHLSHPTPRIIRPGSGSPEGKNGFSFALALPLPLNGIYGVHPSIAYNLHVSGRWSIRSHASVLYLRSNNANYTHAITKPNVDSIIQPGAPYMRDSIVSTHHIVAQLFGSLGITGVYQHHKVSISAGIAYYHYLYSARGKVTDSTQYHEFTTDVREFQREPFNAAKLSGSRNLQLQLGTGYMLTPNLQAGLQYTMPVFKSKAQKGLAAGSGSAPGITRLELQVRWFLRKK